MLPGVWEGATSLDWRAVLVCTPDRLACDVLGDVGTVPLLASYDGRVVLVAETVANDIAQAVAESEPIGPLDFPPPSDPPLPPPAPDPPAPPLSTAPPSPPTAPGPPATDPRPRVRPALRARPTITGRAVPGALLRCSPGRWSGDPTRLAYRWLRNGRQLARTVATYPVRPSIGALGSRAA